MPSIVTNDSDFQHLSVRLRPDGFPTPESRAPLGFGQGPGAQELGVSCLLASLNKLR
jgi:hypothetical protein